jgi:hypothetical protein
MILFDTRLTNPAKKGVADDSDDRRRYGDDYPLIPQHAGPHPRKPIDPYSPSFKSEQQQGLSGANKVT